MALCNWREICVPRGWNDAEDANSSLSPDMSTKIQVRNFGSRSWNEEIVAVVSQR